MTENDKAKCRATIHSEHWLKVGIVEPIPSPLLWNKEVLVMYEDYDGLPCRCKALIIHNTFADLYFIATSGASKGNVLKNVFCI